MGKRTERPPAARGAKTFKGALAPEPGTNSEGAVVSKRNGISKGGGARASGTAVGGGRLRPAGGRTGAGAGRGTDDRDPRIRSLVIRGARENNLKNVDLEIPHDTFTVVTGVSGSGKSSLAFETIYAEGQRRYIETFSPYTRQFFDKIKRPDVDVIENVRPAVAIRQRTRIVNSRSTVGSITSINDYLRIVWCNLAEPVCRTCARPIELLDPPALAHKLRDLFGRHAAATHLVCAPVVSKGSVTEEAERLAARGYTRYLDPATGGVEAVDSPVPREGALVVVIDRFRGGAATLERLREAVEQAYDLSDGLCLVVTPGRPGPSGGRRPFLNVSGGPDGINRRTSAYTTTLFGSRNSCPHSDERVKKPKPSLFSYNHPHGACPECKGFGNVLMVDPDLVVPEPKRSLRGHALQCWAGEGAKGEYKALLKFCDAEGIPTDVPWSRLPRAARDAVFRADTDAYTGVLPWFKWVEKKTYKMHVRVFLSKYRAQVPCPSCGGSRLKSEALSFLVRGRAVSDVWEMPVGRLLEWVDETRREAAGLGRLPRQLADVFRSLETRLAYMADLGLTYLSLSRPMRTLSGGETQRVNLAGALGSGLASTQFILDEPSVGLHPRDTGRLVAAVRGLGAAGNSVVAVEHDTDFIRAAEHVVELGPDAGSGGGRVVYAGPASSWGGVDETPPHDLVAARRTDPAAATFSVTDVSARNLRGLSVAVPVGRFVCVTGVSGSGKSTLVRDVVLRTAEDVAAGRRPSYSVSGLEAFGRVALVDQSPLARSPRANVATYTKIWDAVRGLLGSAPEAEARGLTKSSFSFNVEGGRCPACKGAGFVKEDMQFLSDVFIPCEVCLGGRFTARVAEVTVLGKTVSDYLAMTVAEARNHFADHPAVRDPSATLCSLGLGHLTLGHPLSELSGGEAQRLKLVPFVTEARGETGSLLVFDEPTTGLHVKDVHGLVRLFQSLRDAGHTVLCVEHNLTLVSLSDHVIDLGPEGGTGGGTLVAAGPPEVFLSPGAPGHTAEHLRRHHAGRSGRAEAPAPAARTLPPAAISIRGARSHNLKDVSVDVPLGRFVALTGASGSGKSTLAKDILYAEGQRRYLDCLSPYARQFVKGLERPDVDEVRNVTPTVCVYQHTFQPGTGSTVATMSEVGSFLRLLFAKTGTQYCVDHPDTPILMASPAAVTDRLLSFSGGAVRVLAPVVKSKKGMHDAVFTRAIEEEVPEVRSDGVFGRPSSFVGTLAKGKHHSVDYVVGKFRPDRTDRAVIEECVARALSLGGGELIIHSGDDELLLSTSRTCPVCGKGYYKPDPEDLSSGSRRGRCAKCGGSGRTAGGKTCPACDGTRLGPVGRNLRLGGHTFPEVLAMCPPDVATFLGAAAAGNGPPGAVAAPVIKEALSKLECLSDVGLDYVPLARECATLSGGELQRLRLAAAMGSPLSGVLYIFDEPSIGLHPDDNDKVLARLARLRDDGNSVVMIEHDARSILAADHVIDVGPGGGAAGGRIVYNGPADRFLDAEGSVTAAALKERRGAGHAPAAPRGARDGGELRVTGGPLHNVAHLDVRIPLGRVVTVAGVSGAGKSTLVHGMIGETMSAGGCPGTSWSLRGVRVKSTVDIDRLLYVDQRPIGANSRSTPASYLKLWDEIRRMFASTNAAVARGWNESYFSYNTGKGRCPTCKGLGRIKLEMSFLADARHVCDDCGGSRFAPATDSVRYLGLSPSEVLGLTFDEAADRFAAHRRFVRSARLVCSLGLGYLTLGQDSTTLSGGESQRLKLAAELGRGGGGHTLYVLDEPTTGLHVRDVDRLMATFEELVSKGNSVLLVEHDADVVLRSDEVIEMGPGAGPLGGSVVFQGPPADLLRSDTPWGLVLRGGPTPDRKGPGRTGNAPRIPSRRGGTGHAMASANG